MDHAESRRFDVISASLRTAIASSLAQDATAALFSAAGNGDANGAMMALGRVFKGVVALVDGTRTRTH